MQKKIVIVVGILFLLALVSAALVYVRQRPVAKSMYSYGEADGRSRKQLANQLAATAGVSDMAIAAPAVKVSPVTPSASTNESTERLVIKTGEISVVVTNVRESAGKITAYATSHGGYVVSSNVSQSGIAPSGTVTIRIPVAAFDTGFADLKALGDVQSENVTGEDVTDQYVDLTARLKNLQATEAQLQEIMRRAVRIQDVLDVQEQLTDVRGNIESLQGRIKYLKDSAAMSSLTVYLSTDPSQLPVVHEPTDTWKPLAVAKEALRSLLELAKTFGSLAIWFVIFIPLWVVLAAIVWGVTRLARRVFKKPSV